MKKNIFKRLAFLSASAITASTLSICAFASSQKDVVNRSFIHSYKNPWEYSRVVRNGLGVKVGTICYGYDVEFIHEDFCWTKGSEAECVQTKAGVKRQDYDYDFVFGLKRSAGNWSKSEVTHKVDQVTYRIYFPTTYENLYVDSEYYSWNKND